MAELGGGRCRIVYFPAMSADGFTFYPGCDSCNRHHQVLFCWVVALNALQKTNISHLGKRKIIFKSEFWWDMLVPKRAVFCFSPRSLGKWSNLTRYFSKGLVQPPTYKLSFDTVYPRWGVKYLSHKGMKGSYPPPGYQWICKKRPGALVDVVSLARPLKWYLDVPGS